MSGRCNQGTTPPAPSSFNCQVFTTNAWPGAFPQAYNCATTSGPKIGMDPTIYNGSNSFSTATLKRFTEVWVRDVTTNQEVSRKCWSNDNGDAGNSVWVQVPTSHPFEVHFKQYDGCTSACMQVLVNGSYKGVRLIWEKTLLQYYGTQNMSVTISPESLNNWIVCN